MTENKKRIVALILSGAALLAFAAFLIWDSGVALWACLGMAVASVGFEVYVRLRER